METAKKSVKIESIDPFEPQIMAQQGNVDIAPIEDPNATDYSSSFDDTLSGTENCTEMSDNEVQSSHLYGSDSFPFDGFSSMFPMRKKKLTSHWRNYIRPLMWRCKWAQLKMMQFRSQASQYDREIARLDKRKQQNLDHFALGNLGSKSLTSTSAGQGEKVMKRRKRKRVEDDPADIASYFSQHNLFSYAENKRADQEGSSVIEEFVNPVIPERNSAGREGFGIKDDCSFPENMDNSEFIGEILQNIEVAHSRVQMLKSRLVAVLEENCMNFSSSEDLSFLVIRDGQTSTPNSPNLSACNDDTSSLGALLNEIGDFVVPDSMVESFGVNFSVPDIIESTDSLLSSVDVTMLHPQIRDSCEAIMDNVEIQNEAAERERLDSKNTNNQTIRRNEEMEVNVKEEPAAALENEPVSDTVTHPEQSKPTSFLAPETNGPVNKRKRGERKAGSSGWHRWYALQL